MSGILIWFNWKYFAVPTLLNSGGGALCVLAGWPGLSCYLQHSHQAAMHTNVPQQVGSWLQHSRSCQDRTWRFGCQDQGTSPIWELGERNGSWMLDLCFFLQRSWKASPQNLVFRMLPGHQLASKGRQDPDKFLEYSWELEQPKVVEEDTGLRQTSIIVHRKFYKILQ